METTDKKTGPDQIPQPFEVSPNMESEENAYLRQRPTFPRDVTFIFDESKALILRYLMCGEHRKVKKTLKKTPKRTSEIAHQW